MSLFACRYGCFCFWWYRFNVVVVVVVVAVVAAVVFFVLLPVVPFECRCLVVVMVFVAPSGKRRQKIIPKRFQNGVPEVPGDPRDAPGIPLGTPLGPPRDSPGTPWSPPVAGGWVGGRFL